jgi:hypothetical protein
VQRQKALMSWMSQIIDEKKADGTGRSSKSSPVPTLQLTKLNRDSLGGFLALVFPLLLRRQDVAVEVSTRERRTTAYDVRVQVTKLGKKKKHMTMAPGMRGGAGASSHTTGPTDMKRSSSETSLPQQFGRTNLTSSSSTSSSLHSNFDTRGQGHNMIGLSPRGGGRSRGGKYDAGYKEEDEEFDDEIVDDDLLDDVDESTWRTWHHLALKAAIHGHVEVNDNDDDDGIIEEDED